MSSFDETRHPRRTDGRFAPKPGGGAGEPSGLDLAGPAAPARPLEIAAASGIPWAIDALDASSEHTDPDRLSELAGHQIPSVRERVAANPATWPDDLTRLADALDDGNDQRVLLAVAANPHTPVETCADLAFGSESGDVRARALRPAFAAEWSRWSAARRPGAPPGELDRLADDPSWRVRSQVAAAFRTRPATLTRLAGDPEAAVRRQVVNNPLTPLPVVASLTDDPDPTVASWASMAAASRQSARAGWSPLDV